MHRLANWIVEPGFFSSQPVHVAIVIGGAAAIVSSIVGVFTVMRGQSFAGHALTDVSAAGGSGALLFGINPLFGFVGFSVFAAGVMDVIGVRRIRGRDLATGVVLGASIGLAALILYFDTTSAATTGATQQILFGSIFSLGTSTIPIVVIFGLVSVAIIATLYRPLMLSAVSADMAAARGVPYRFVGIMFMVALAVSVGLSALAIGAILSTALLVGPPATALRLTKQFGWAIAVASILGVVAAWLGVLLAYDSYYWGSGHRGLPVSFFIVSLVFLFYLASGLPFVRSAADSRGRPLLAVEAAASARGAPDAPER